MTLADPPPSMEFSIMDFFLERIPKHLKFPLSWLPSKHILIKPTVKVSKFSPTKN